MSTAKHSPLPWHVYEGGNFVKIGMDGYDEYTEREHYLGGPFAVAETEHNATETHKANHAKALANAELIVRAVNSYESNQQLIKQLREALEDAVRCAGHEHTPDCPMRDYRTPCKCWVAPANAALAAVKQQEQK